MKPSVKEAIRSVLVGVTVIALIVAAILLYGSWNLTKDMPSQKGTSGVELREVASCEKDQLPRSSPSRVEKVEIIGSTLRAFVLANAACGGVYPVKPEARVSGDNIELAWSWWAPPRGPIAACDCTRRIEFLVPNNTIANPTVSIAPASAVP